MPVEGTALPLWGLEIDPDRAKEDFRAFNARDDGKVTTAPAILAASCVLKLMSWAHALKSRLAYTRRSLDCEMRASMESHAWLRRCLEGIAS